MVNGNELGDVGFQKIGTPYSEMDCQAFVEWCLKQCGCDKNLAGSNAWYREVYNHGWIGSPEDCVKMLGCVPKGAFLFIQAFDGEEPMKYRGDGMGNASHIGICTIPRGEGAINSSKSRGGVCESKFKQKTINGGWNKVGLWTEVSYDYGGDTPVPTPKPTPEPSPEPITAVVFAPTGNTVNIRKSPSINSPLVERVKIGETVSVITRGEDWCQIRWQRYIGWMMTRFLIFDDPPAVEDYTITIFGLTKEEADRLHDEWPNSKISVG